MDQKEAILTVEQLQKILLDAEKSGEYLYEELLPIWEEAKGVIEDEQQMVSLYTTFIYLTRRFAEREQSSPNYSTVEELFNEGSNFLDECFEGYSDAGIRFEKNFAFFSYTKLKKTEKAREIWNKLLEGEQSAFPWLEAIALERAYGDIEYARCLFFKALDVVTYRQQEIFGRFVQFEREEGTRDQLDLALARVNAKAAEYNAWTKQQQLHKNHPKTGRTKETGEQKTTKKRDKKEKAKGKKGREEKEGQRKTQKGEEDDKPEEMEAGEESKATIPNGQPPIDGHDIEGTSATFETYSVPLGPVLPGNARPVDLKNKKDKVTKQKEENNERTNSGMAGEKRKRPPSLSENYFPYNVGLEKNKLFVKKLDWSCTGEELKKFFEKFGAVVDARIVTKWNGRSKGCAYVDFADEQSASAALMGADGAEIKGRKISVFLSNPPPAKKAKFSTTATEDKNVATHENISDANTGSQVEREQKQRVKQQKMASGLMPRVAFLTGAGQRVGKASRLMLPTNVISKNRIAETEAKNESPVGIVTESTKEMTL